jgi:hypothetical protein
MVLVHMDNYANLLMVVMNFDKIIELIIGIKLKCVNLFLTKIIVSTEQGVILSILPISCNIKNMRSGK